MAQPPSGGGAAVVALARTKINNPAITYVWAAPADTTAANPSHFDCSGFTAWAYYHATGKKLGHFTGTQFAQLKHRPIAQAQAGDLVFFGPNSQYRNVQAIYHVAIYNGSGGIIEFYDAGLPGRERKLAAHESGLIPYVGICPGNSTGSSSAGASSSAPVWAQVVAFFHAKFPTLKDYQLAAIVGNTQQESGNSPGTQQTIDGSAFGLFQWEGPRLAALRAYANSRGMDPTNLTTQLEFSASELTGGYAHVLTQLQGSSNLTAATSAFELGYEGAGNPQEAKREGFAQGFLNQIRGASGGLEGFTATARGSSGAPDPSTLAAPLTKDQRALIRTYLALWKIDATKAKTDEQLIALYKVGFFVNHIELGPITGPGDAIGGAVQQAISGVENFLTSTFGTLGKWALDAFVIIVGVVLLILAVVLLARSNGTSLSLESTPHRSAGKSRGLSPGGEQLASEAGEAAADTE